MKRNSTDAEPRHLSEPQIDGDRILSGECGADIVHHSAAVTIGEGDDGTLWVLAGDEKQRPRGRDPGVVVELGEVHYEQNGLVRIVNRRVAPDSLERLVTELTGAQVRLGSDLGRRSRIPEGSYAGITVHHVDAHYRVDATDRYAGRLAAMEPLGPNRWLVLSGEESALRRELVNVLMPPTHRALWYSVKHGEKVLMMTGICLAALSFFTAFAAPFAVAAAVGLAVFRVKQRQIVAATHRIVVQPHIARTFERTRAAKRVAQAGELRKAA